MLSFLIKSGKCDWINTVVVLYIIKQLHHAYEYFSWIVLFVFGCLLLAYVVLLSELMPCYSKVLVCKINDFDKLLDVS